MYALHNRQFHMAAHVAPEDAPRPLLFKNPEKGGARRSTNPLIPDWPWRGIWIGPPNSGKRNSLLTLIAHLTPFPRRIVLIHLDPNSTEYDELEVERYSPEEPPAIDEFDREEPCLLIVDEVDIASMPKKTQAEFSRLFFHTSSHYNTSAALCYQEFHRVPPNIRHAMQLYTIFKSVDRNEIGAIERKVSMPKQHLLDIAENILRYQHDSVTIDTQKPVDDPMRLRLNLFTPILRRWGSREVDPDPEPPQE